MSRPPSLLGVLTVIAVGLFRLDGEMRAARDPPSELEDGPLIIIEGPAGLNLGFWEGIGGHSSTVGSILLPVLRVGAGRRMGLVPGDGRGQSSWTEEETD